MGFLYYGARSGNEGSFPERAVEPARACRGIQPLTLVISCDSLI